MVAGGGKFLPGNGRGRTSKGTNDDRVVKRRASISWAEYIKDQEIGKSEMSWTEFKTLVTSQFTPEYANIRAEVAWLDLRQTHSIKAYVGKFQRAVSTFQHISDYDKQLKFIHELQPWARKLIFQMPQLLDNLQDLMRMAERLGDDAVDNKESSGEVKPAKVGKDNNSWQEAQKRQACIGEVGTQIQQCAKRGNVEGMGGL